MVLVGWTSPEALLMFLNFPMMVCFLLLDFREAILEYITSLSPDQRYLVYASMTPVVNIVNVESSKTESLANDTEIHEGLDFSIEDDEDEFGNFSVKFSTDGRELVAASSDASIYVYDLQ